MLRRLVLVAFCQLPIWFAVAAAPAEKTGCQAHDLEKKLTWISSATWVPSKSSIIVVNPFLDEIVAYSPKGKFAPINDIDLGSPKPVVGSMGRAGENSFLLRSFGDRFFTLSPTLAVRSAREFSALNLKTSTGIGSIYQWSAGESRIFAYGSLVKGGGDFDLGFFSAPADSPGSAKMIKPFVRGDYYTLGYPYTTVMGRSAFFLLMDKEVHLYRQDEGEAARDLGLISPNFRSAPDFKTPMTGPSSAKARFDEIETLSIPAGLYTEADDLYMLTRTPGADRKTQWALHKLDPNSGKVLGSMGLPTTANHLTVVPSPDAWYIFERGPILGPNQQQPINRMLTIQGESIRSLETLKDCPVEN